MATLTFYGATNGVTGSAYLLETNNATVLLECGLIQGRREQEEANRSPFPFDPVSLDTVVLSHAHLDHSGRLPQLSAAGFQGRAWMTRPTSELLEIMLKDAAFLSQRDADWENKRRRRAGKRLIKPLYTLDDVERFLLCREGVAYNQRHTVAQDVDICFRDAGHILGSAIVELFITEAGKEKKLVFSGDLGNSCAALLRDPAVVEYADVLLLESTYGDRNHRPMDETLSEFEGIVEQAVENGGNILIPSFAVGRTQEIIFRLGELYQRGKLHNMAVYLDSPMAIAATEIYHRYQHVFNDEDGALLHDQKSSSLHSFLPCLTYSRTTQESMALNRIADGAIIIAGSGMCTGGRIRHHFKHNLWRNDAHVIIVGFQASGTPGRALVDGAKTFRVGPEKIAVNAHIHTLGGFSAHASQQQLLGWAKQFHAPEPELFLVHGESKAKCALAECFQQIGWPASIPTSGEKLRF